GMEISLDNEKNLEKVCEIIGFFIANKGTVTDVYYRDKAEDFFSSITPVHENVNQGVIKEQLTLDSIEDLDRDSKDVNKYTLTETKNITEETNPSDENQQTQIETSTPKQDEVKGRLSNPESLKYLTSAYKVGKQYKNNPRIIAIKRELSSLEYKEFKV